MEILQETVRLPVRLLDVNGLAVTGITPANIGEGSTIGIIQIITADGVIAPLALTNGVNWFEIDAVNTPGMYQFILPASYIQGAAKLGPMQWYVQSLEQSLGQQPGAPNFFVNFVGNAVVEEVHTVNCPKTRKGGGCCGGRGVRILF
jgi:hypothetical protein